MDSEIWQVSGDDHLQAGAIVLESFVDEPVIVAGLGDPAPHTALLQHLRTAFSRRLEFDAVASASDFASWSFSS